MTLARDRYRRIKALFVEVSEMTEADRAVALERCCVGDTDLRFQVERLLDAHQRGTWPVQDAMRSASGAHPASIAGYLINGLLGVGGMSIVYRARQRQPARDVALKVLRSDIADPRLQLRFEREAKLLGRLLHPGIAQIYEAGQWEDDASAHTYFAMELVDGSPLTEFADREALKPRERLAMLADIADAVEYAHQRGVIHRDLKPSNILVTQEGAAKILDFGVARVTDSDVCATTIATDVGQLVGTIPYMSPEQASGEPAAIDCRSDVYALGVLMYELLAGEPPLGLLHKNVTDAVRAIHEDDPVPLSSVNRAFRGDLDTIVAKALEKDRTRRYSTAAEFAADLRRHLNDEPISARPASLRYQLGKFSRRHRGLVAGAALAAFMLVAGSITSTVFAIRANQRNAQLSVETERLGALNRFFTEMLDAANPDLNPLNLERPSDVRVVDVLDHASKRLAETFHDQPRVEIAVRATLAGAYGAIEQPDNALREIELALALARAEMAPEDPERIELEISRAGLLNALGRRAEAEKELTQLTQRCERERGHADNQTIASLNTLFAVLYYEGRRDEARAVGEDALRRADTLPDNPAERRNALGNLAYLLTDLGELERAESFFREALELTRRAHGEEHVATFAAWRNLAWVLRKQKKIEEGTQILQRVVDAHSRRFGPDHGLTLLARNNLAVLLRDGGHEAEALEALEQILQAFERTNPNSGIALLARHNVAKSRYLLGHYERAVADATDALARRIRAHGDDASPVADTRHLLATILAAQSNHADACSVFERALETYVRLNGEDEVTTMACRLDYARSLLAAGSLALAEDQFRALHESSLRVNGPTHETTLAREGDLDSVRSLLAEHSSRD